MTAADVFAKHVIIGCIIIFHPSATESFFLFCDAHVLETFLLVQLVVSILRQVLIINQDFYNKNLDYVLALFIYEFSASIM